MFSVHQRWEMEIESFAMCMNGEMIIDSSDGGEFVRVVGEHVERWIMRCFLFTNLGDGKWDFYPALAQFPFG